ncbi:MAG: Gfo/Idh/MocA family oxidoreductase [Verrucomicrobiales bacterium]|nr:Gfo/Idh/MocA family oxidoreductase [Verrucomicrobiales bacterium]
MKPNPSTSRSRRSVLTKGAAAFAGMQFLDFPVFGQDAPGNKINLAGIGIGGMGKANLRQCSGENIGALCDVDERHSAKVRAKYPDANFYVNYQEMLDGEKDLDGVVIATPDHTHAVVTQAAMDKGLHVYTQKPLTRTVHEARVITEMAAKKPDIQTQMGNQGRSSNSIRQLKEWIEAGAIGNVTEVRAWTDRPVGGQWYSTFPITGRPEEEIEVPPFLDWDTWIGPASYRPFHTVYHPHTWRAFYDFGTGPLGDMGCHILDPAFYALDLGAPDTVEATSTHWEEKVSAETYPRATRVRYQFPARNGKPAVTLNWSDGRLLPYRPPGVTNDVKLPASGALFIGDEGVILHGSHGASGLKLLPEEKNRKFQANRPPETIPRVQGGHEKDWIRACKDGKPASSNFSYGGALTEMVLLGVLAIRVPNQRLEWDAKAMRFTNHEGANELISPPYREGWELKG